MSELPKPVKNMVNALAELRDSAASLSELGGEYQWMNLTIANGAQSVLYHLNQGPENLIMQGVGNTPQDADPVDPVIAEAPLADEPPVPDAAPDTPPTDTPDAPPADEELFAPEEPPQS